ncbi:MAG: hypothetical protein L7U50_05345, partial [Candidatus Nanopelagicales bacterium]|nr:hypothetical protein [Candidatus Nanopelagicales bacterium]
MSQPHDITASDRRRQERSTWRNGLIASVLLHLIIFLGWSGNVIPDSPFAAAGPRAGDNRAAAGSMQALNIRTPPSRPIIQPPTPLAVSVDVETVEWEDEVEYDPASVLGEKPGLDEGPGLEDGTGQGDG